MPGKSGEVQGVVRGGRSPHQPVEEVVQRRQALLGYRGGMLLRLPLDPAGVAGGGRAASIRHEHREGRRSARDPSGAGGGPVDAVMGLRRRCSPARVSSGVVAQRADPSGLGPAVRRAAMEHHAGIDVSPGLTRCRGGSTTGRAPATRPCARLCTMRPTRCGPAPTTTPLRRGAEKARQVPLRWPGARSRTAPGGSLRRPPVEHRAAAPRRPRAEARNRRLGALWSLATEGPSQKRRNREFDPGHPADPSAGFDRGRVETT